MIRLLPPLLRAMALLALLATPAFAQDRTVTLDIELTVTGQPPEDATFAALISDPVQRQPVCVPLTDPDADGVYASTKQGEGDPGDEVVVSIVQGAGLRNNPFFPNNRCPAGDLTTIRNFGTVSVTEDTVLTASISFEEDNQQDEPRDDTEDDTQDERQNSQHGDDDQDETPAEMPDTGGGGNASPPLGRLALAASVLAGGYTLLRQR